MILIAGHTMTKDDSVSSIDTTTINEPRVESAAFIKMDNRLDPARTVIVH